jgi:hypothetical protein
MAAPAGYYADATKGPSPRYEKAAKAVRAIQTILLDDADLQYYVALDKENVDLAARNQTLETDLESRDRKIGSLLRQRDDALDKLSSTNAELEITKKKREALDAEFAAAQEALREKEKKVASREAEFAKEKAALRRELDFGRDTLGKLRDFSIDLKPVANNTREMWAKSFLPLPGFHKLIMMTTKQKNEPEQNILGGKNIGRNSLRRGASTQDHVGQRPLEHRQGQCGSQTQKRHTPSFIQLHGSEADANSSLSRNPNTRDPRSHPTADLPARGRNQSQQVPRRSPRGRGLQPGGLRSLRLLAPE